MTALKIERMGDQVGVTLPQDVVEKLGLAADGRLFLVDAGNGEYRLSANDPEAARLAETERQVKIGLEFMNRYEATFRALAK